MASTATAEPARVASRGGILRVYNFDALVPDAFDPHLSLGGSIANVHDAIFSRLLRYDDAGAGTLTNDLAAALPEQPDELTYVISLRDNARWHDTPFIRLAYPNVAGRNVSAADVRYSIERQLSRSSAQVSRFFRGGQWNVVDRVEERDDRTVAITLKSPVAPFLSFLAGPHAYVVPREVAAAGEIPVTSPIGSGPFLLESFEPGVAVRVGRNPGWHARNDDRDGAGSPRPFVDGYHAFLAPQEDLFQRAAFERKIVDATPFVDSAAYDAALTTNLEDIELQEREGTRVLASRFLLDRAPFSDDRLRRAVHLAIDRRALIDLLYPPLAGRASAHLSGPIPRALSRWALAAGDLEKRPGYGAARDEDLADARALWSAAQGDMPVTEVRVFFNGVPRIIPERAVAAVQRHLQEALGVAIVPAVDTSGGAVISAALRRNVEGATDGVATFTFGIEDGGPDLDDWLYPFRSGQPANTYRLQDAALDAQIDRQRAEFDADARAELGRDIQDYLLAKVNARIEYCTPVDRRLAWGYMRNFPLSFGGAGGASPEDAWLDASHPAWRGRP